MSLSLKSLSLFKLERFFLFLSFLFLPTQLGKHFWPSSAYIFSLRIDYLSPTIYLWDLLIIATFILFIIRKQKLNKTALLCFTVFLISQGLSLINSSNINAGFVRLEQYLVAGLFGLYLASNKITDYRKILFFSLVVNILFESLLALGQFTLSRSLGFWIFGERQFDISLPSIAKFNWYNDVLLRPYATFPHPNVLAAYLVLFIPMLFVLAENKREKFVAKVIFLLSSLTTVLTFSRTVLIVLIAELSIILNKSRKLLILLLLIATPFVWVRFNSIFNFDNLSFIRREELAVVALVQVRENPFLGVGINNFIIMAAETTIPSGQNRFFQPVHNIYLLTLAETGLIGFLGFMLFILIPIYISFKLKTLYSKLILMQFAIILFLGLFDHYFLTLPQGQRMFFMIWGIALSFDKNGYFRKTPIELISAGNKKTT